MKNEKPCVAVLDDDADLCRLLRVLLEDEYEVVMARDGTELCGLVDSGAVDAVVLDIGLPDEDGISIARKIRSGSGIPLIFLSGNSSEQMIVEGLTLGADDYVTKPFQNAVLLIRMRNTLSRGKRLQAEPRRIQFGAVAFAVGEQRLIGADGCCVKLTEKESMILAALAVAEKQTLSRDEILGKIDPRDWDSPSRAVEVHMSNLRRKLTEIGAAENPIASLRGVGYRLNLEVKPA